jgi:hypothetical protein
MRQPPAADSTTVQLSANGVAFSSCSLQFNKANFNRFQAVKLLPNPTLFKNGKEQEIDINATFCAGPSGKCDKKKQTLKCKQTGMFYTINTYSI